MSPDDVTEDVYRILETVTKGEDFVEKIVIQCNKCGSQICLVGFDFLNKIG